MNAKVNWGANLKADAAHCVDLLEAGAPHDIPACVIIDLGQSARRDERRATRFLDHPTSGTQLYCGETALVNHDVMEDIYRVQTVREAAENGEVTFDEQEYMRFLESQDDAESAMLLS